jgi:hypothetical protein
MIASDQFLADMRKEAKLNQLIGGPEGEDVVYVFNSDDELLEWAQKKPVENLLKECLQYIKHVQQRRNDVGAEESIKRDFIQSVERVFQLAQQEKVDLKSGGDQRAFLEKMAERLSKSGDPALVWEHINFGGDCLPITAGIPDLAWANNIPIFGKNWNDMISSVQVWNGVLVLAEHTWFRGAKLWTGGLGYSERKDLTQVFTSSGVSWNDLASSASGTF